MSKDRLFSYFDHILDHCEAFGHTDILAYLLKSMVVQIKFYLQLYGFGTLVVNLVSFKSRSFHLFRLDLDLAQFEVERR